MSVEDTSNKAANNSSILIEDADILDCGIVSLDQDLDSDQHQVAKRIRLEHPDRPVRTRNPVERYGISEKDVNDDDLFLLAAENHQQELVYTSTRPQSETVNQTVPSAKGDDSSVATKFAVMSPGEKIIFKTLLEMAADVTVLKSMMVESMGDTEVKRKKAIKSVGNAQLAAIGLPLKQTADLGKFEYDLLKEEFRTEVVSIIYF